MSSMALDRTIGPRPARPGAHGRRTGESSGRDAAAGGLRLTRRGRVVVVLLALAGCLGGAWLTGTASAGEPGRGVEVVRHAVVPGDTMWALARSVAQPGEDVRDVVVELERLNRLPSADLRVGEVVLLPVHRG